MLDKRYLALMELLKTHAPNVPPLRQIAAQTGFANGSSVRYALERLQRLGKITMVTRPRQYTEIYLKQLTNN